MVQVLLLAVLIYWFFRFVRLNGLLFGYVLLYLACGALWWLTACLNLPFVQMCTRQAVVYVMPLVGVLLFQNDLRRLMIYMARGYIAFSKRNSSYQLERNRREFIDEIVKAVCALTHHESWRRYLLSEYKYSAYRDLPEKSTGALIALQSSVEIQRDLDTSSVGAAGLGVPLSCRVEWTLLRTIFYPGTPLHDGGVIIDRGGTIICAGCRFPAADNDPAQIAHTRHNAGIGLSAKVPDAWVIVVSEETGRVSICSQGRIIRQEGPRQMREALCQFYGVGVENEQEQSRSMGFLRRIMRTIYDGAA